MVTIKQRELDAWNPTPVLIILHDGLYQFICIEGRFSHLFDSNSYGMALLAKLILPR